MSPARGSRLIVQVEVGRWLLSSSRATGSWASALWSNTRCHSPADSSATGRSRRCSRSARPKELSIIARSSSGHGVATIPGGRRPPNRTTSLTESAEPPGIACRGDRDVARHARPLSQTGSPSSSTTPARGRKRRASVRSKVVLPDPFGPKRASTVPDSMLRLTPASTSRRP